MIVYGLISPHPPIIIPSIGGANLSRVSNTITAMEQASAELGQAAPQELIIIAPHEGHGFEVPMYYLTKHIPGSTKVEEILVTEPSYEYHYKLGQSTAKELEPSPIRTAIIASGDLSHVLKAEGPYGYNPALSLIRLLLRLCNDAMCKPC